MKDEWKPKHHEDTDIADDVVFEVELICQIEINIDNTFSKQDSEERIKATIAPFSHIISIRSADSRTKAELQFVDNLCSVVCLYESGRDDDSSAAERPVRYSLSTLSGDR